MNPALWAAKTGLDAQQTRMTVTSNNLANVNTNGFKKGRAVFEDLLYQNVRQVGASTSQDTQLPSGLHARHRRARRRDREDVHAGQPDADGQLARRRHQRPRLLPGPAAGRHARLHARRQLPGQRAGRARDLERLSRCSRASRFRTARRASRSARTASSPCSSPARPRRRRSARCSSSTSSIPPACSRAARTCCSSPPPAARRRRGTPGLNGLGLLEQGSLESSNVNVVEELVNMIETQRAYEMNSKAISTTDQMLEYVTNQL